MSDNRRFPRVAALKRCELVSPNLDTPCSARIINQSAYGVLIELDYPLPVDDVPIKIYLADEIRGTIDYNGSETMVGMVRWCNQQLNSWSGMYQAGIELISLKPRKDVI